MCLGIMILELKEDINVMIQRIQQSCNEKKFLWHMLQNYIYVTLHQE
jgi:hypothetical protein